MNRTAMIAGIVGGLLLIWGGGDGSSPIAGDVLDECYQADRASKVRIIQEMAATDFPSDDQQADWWNDQIEKARAKDFEPFISQLAEAIEGGTLVEFAEAIE
jgi:hypothetical protein